MAQLGYKPIQIWVDPDELKRLKAAAEKDGRPLTRYMLRAALAAATFTLEESQGG